MQINSFQFILIYFSSLIIYFLSASELLRNAKVDNTRHGTHRGNGNKLNTWVRLVRFNLHFYQIDTCNNHFILTVTPLSSCHATSSSLKHQICQWYNRLIASDTYKITLLSFDLFVRSHASIRIPSESEEIYASIQECHHPWMNSTSYFHRNSFKTKFTRHVSWSAHKSIKFSS